MKNMQEIKFSGSYSSNDVVFLLKNLNGLIEERGNLDREHAVKSGAHYSEMLPIEYEPPSSYIELFHLLLQQEKINIANHVARVAEVLFYLHGKDIVLVSLARAGTPIGVLIKRYLLQKYKIEVPHYSISIIRDKGLDLNAIKYIVKKHPDYALRFIDGWTGKGAISKELIKSCRDIKSINGIELNDSLVVLADPGKCAGIYSTREDVLIPSACLNATVSGLISRTVLNSEFIKDEDFHGTKYYDDLKNNDLSCLYIEQIQEMFPKVISENEIKLLIKELTISERTFSGVKDVLKIKQNYKIEDSNYIKPGIGETTRVLLRRVTWKILVKDITDKRLNHILFLADERNVAVEEYKDMSYLCCGLIKNV
ncbi:cysteine protease StiP family protein [Exiguobacterium artemiae]|uniref:cysteine protease StiP family protein n=1 Tax=Exiguobacterium artemiae TaxID=340145 RepID=UPI002964CEC4|nr:cysteine protease StiP family protein [Exiguobacterium sibiricum]MDW2884624.1 cysteine protease StiP family protein [Exiguobacterium sibiricum]